MPHLVAPTVDLYASFVDAMREFRSEGRGAPDDGSSIGEDLRASVDGDEQRFVSYVAWLRAEALPDTPRPADRVASTTLWWVDGDDYIGRIAIRHDLTDWLREYGGHIGYDVRASRRRQGHASAMLRAALPLAHDLGIDPALLTCDSTNVASRRVIEGAGGVFEDERGGKLRFWLPTHAPSA